MKTRTHSDASKRKTKTLLRKEVIDEKFLLDLDLIMQKNLHRDQFDASSLQVEAAYQDLDPAGELCQVGPLLAGHDDQQVDGEDDA